MSRWTIMVVVACLVAFCCGACSSEPATDTPDKIKTQKDALSISDWRIDENTANILYTYMDEKQAFQTVEQADAVPDPFRNDVIVVDLSRPPEERRSTTKVVVADLNRKEGGHFHLRLEDRARFETAIKHKRQWRLSPVAAMNAPAPGAQSGPPPGQPALNPGDKHDKIVLYGATWCGYCRKARQILSSSGIAFVDKDIEKTPGAAAELQALCQARGQTCNGVPVIDFKGRLLLGFDEATLRGLLAAEKAKAGAKSP